MTNIKNSSQFSKYLILGVSLSTLALAGCAGSTGEPSPSYSAETEVNSMNPTLKTTSIDRLMERALADAEANGNSQEALAILQNVQARNSDDPIVAARYARALRDDNQVNAAVRVLMPFTKGEEQSIEAVTEMAMTQLALGDFKTAEKYAIKATKMNPRNARGYLALGTAQDAQSNHQEAEVSFRKGLKFWQGDPTPIMNNLALNLASQGHLEESLSLLEKALKISPNRMDLERNRRIIATLVETSGPRPPAPSGKPESQETDTAQNNEPNDDKQNAIPRVPQSKPQTIVSTEQTPASNNVSEPSAEELNAQRVQQNREKKEAEQKAPSPAPQVQEIEPAADVSTPTTIEDMTAPKTVLKNLRLKSSDGYN